MEKESSKKLFKRIAFWHLLFSIFAVSGLVKYNSEAFIRIINFQFDLQNMIILTFVTAYVVPNLLGGFLVLLNQFKLAKQVLSIGAVFILLAFPIGTIIGVNTLRIFDHSDFKSI